MDNTPKENKALVYPGVVARKITFGKNLKPKRKTDPRGKLCF